MPGPWHVSVITGNVPFPDGIRGVLSPFAARVFRRYPVGKVLGVYSRTINALFGPYILTLADASSGGLPQGILLVGFPRTLGSLGVRTGHVVVLQDSALAFVEAGATLPIAQFELWSPPWEEHPLEQRRPSVSVEKVAEFAAARAPRGGLAPILGVWDRLSELEAIPAGLPRPAGRAWKSLRRYLKTGEPVALLDLIGLGPGLTPSGDDVLRGYFAVRSVTGQLPPWTRGLLRAAASRTNALSCQLLWHATRRRLSQRLGEVVVALITDSDWQEPVERALREGHTSGADALVGVLLALEAQQL